MSAARATLPGVSRRDDLWRLGERAAWEAYRARGFRLVARNWRSKLGELDLVVAREDLVVFCEVKARRGSAFGGPHEAVTETKRRKVRALAQAFLSMERRGAERYRFDVASVTVDPGGSARVHVFEDAF